MRRLAALASLAILALPAAGCGGGGSSATEDVTRAAMKTARAGSLEADFRISGQGLEGSGSGVFNTGEHSSGQLSMKVTANGREIPIDTIITGDVFYMRSPVFARSGVTGGKQWIKLDLAKLARQRGLELGGLLDASPTPANALAYLQGVGEVDELGSESVAGTKATHYHVTVDIRRAADRADERERKVLRRVISEAGIETLPLDVWIDGNGYIRKVSYAEHQGRQQAAQVTMVLHDFGARTTIKPPPGASVIDLMKLQGS